MATMLSPTPLCSVMGIVFDFVMCLVTLICLIPAAIGLNMYIFVIHDDL